MTLRSEKILACETVAQKCGALLAKGVAVNQVIVGNKLPLPPLDLEPIHWTMQRAEEMLKNLELKATA